MLNNNPSATLKNMETDLDQRYMVKPSGIMHWQWEGGVGGRGKENDSCNHGEIF